MWDAKPGDKVVLKPQSKWPPPPKNPAATVTLSAKKVYTIRSVALAWDGTTMRPGCHLVEITNPEIFCTLSDTQTGYTEPWYLLDYFEKVVDNKGMETLRACLDPNKKIEGREIEKTLGLARKLNKRFRNRKEETK